MAVKGASLWNRILARFTPQSLANSNLSSYDTNGARVTRAVLYRSFYEDYTYKTTFNLANAFKEDYETYKHIRSIYNPAWRIGRFYYDRLYLGTDLEKAFPVKSKDKAYATLKEDIYKVLNLSNFVNFKGSIGSGGSIQGDTFLWNRYNPHLKIFELVPIRSDQVLNVTIDPYGKVTSYVINVPTLTDDNNLVFEEGELVNGVAVTRKYEGYKDTPSQTAVLEGFDQLPLTLITHAKDGNVFGSSEIRAKLTAFVELDSLAANLGDYVSTMVNAPWMLSGVRGPRNVATDKDIEINRTSVPVIYAKDPQARPHALVANLPINDTLAHIVNLLGDLQDTYPELRLAAGLDRTSGDLSGRALKVSRQEAEDKLLSIRPNYDLGLYRAVTQNLLLNSRRESALSLNYKKLNPLEVLFDVAERTVFELAIAEKIENEQGLWVTLQQAQKAGADPEIALARLGWDESEIQEFTSSPAYERFLNRLTFDSDGPSAINTFRSEPNLPFSDTDNDPA